MTHLLLKIALIFGAIKEKPDAAQNFVHSLRPVLSSGRSPP
jgi:hypothetical protein